jgi:ubiquinone/menaquinone biosynthesis C-methylase UbiE
MDYEYHGLLAASWDLFRGDTSNWEDKFFFQDLIGQYGQPVLDVGCGTGRLLLDFLGQGIDVDGVDNSPEMLALCRRKATGLGLDPTVYEAWMEMLALPRRYRTIMVPSSSFQLVVELQKAASAMRRLYAHLEPSGALIMPFMIMRAPGTPSETTDWRLTGEKERPEDGTILKRWSRARYDVENQLEHTEDWYELSLNGQVLAEEHHQRSPAVRWYSQVEAAALYKEAGFQEVRLFKDFTHDPATPEDTLFSVVGIKPGMDEREL